MQRDKKQLQKASDRLWYECWMLNCTAHALASGIIPEGVVHNALLESFLIHARALTDFLRLSCPEKVRSKKQREDDVIAPHFFTPPEGWQPGAMPEILQDTKTRVGKDLCHITYTNLDAPAEQKPWDFVKIADEVKKVTNGFVDKVPKNLLGQRWKKMDHEQPEKAGLNNPFQLP